MYLMALDGAWGRVDVSIFADTKNEPQWVYDQLDRLERIGRHQIPIIRVSYGNLAEDWFNGQKSRVREENAMGAAMPLHLKMPDGSKGMAIRTCTNRYKIEPCLAAAREAMGLHPGQQAAGKHTAECLIGFSTDEASRQKPAKEPWITNRFPLCNEIPMSRWDCLRWIEKRGHPEVKRSACIQCPYHSNSEWRDLKADPSEWAKVVAFERKLQTTSRFVSAAGDPEKAHLRGKPFLHPSLVPIDEADLEDVDPKQMNLFAGDCDSMMCGY